MSAVPVQQRGISRIKAKFNAYYDVVNKLSERELRHIVCNAEKYPRELVRLARVRIWSIHMKKKNDVPVHEGYEIIAYYRDSGLVLVATNTGRIMVMDVNELAEIIAAWKKIGRTGIRRKNDGK